MSFEHLKKDKKKHFKLKKNYPSFFISPLVERLIYHQRNIYPGVEPLLISGHFYNPV
jgi:hypothetical protein